MSGTSRHLPLSSLVTCRPGLCGAITRRASELPRRGVRRQGFEFGRGAGSMDDPATARLHAPAELRGGKLQSGMKSAQNLALS